MRSLVILGFAACMKAGCFLILLCILLGGKTSAQEGRLYGDRYTTTIAFEANTSLSSSGWMITPTFSLFYNNHKVSAGLMAPVYDVWNHGQGYGGIHLSYKYFAAKRRKKANLYFCYHMMGSIQDRSSVTPEIPQDSGWPLVTDISYRYEHLLGIGTDFHFGKRAYLFMEWNAGITLNWLTFENSPILFEWYSNGMGRIGIGFNLMRKRP